MPAAKTLVICKSVHHQNTARVAERIASVLGAAVASPEDVPYGSLDGYDLIGIGSGIYYGGLHADVRAWVRGLPRAPHGAMRVFVFTTSGLPLLTQFWHGPLKADLARRGFRVVGEFHCRGFDTWGPLGYIGGINRGHPDDRDLERAAGFARRLLADQSGTAATYRVAG